MKRETKKDVEKKLKKHLIMCIGSGILVLGTAVLIGYFPLVRNHILSYDSFYGSLMILVFGVFIYTLFRSGYLFGRLKVTEENSIN